MKMLTEKRERHGMDLFYDETEKLVAWVEWDPWNGLWRVRGPFGMHHGLYDTRAAARDAVRWGFANQSNPEAGK